MNENDLMSRLVASKAIMDNPKFAKTRNGMNDGLPPTSQPVNQPYLSSVPKENTKPVGVPTVDAIKNSRLPDEIKKLMMEHPIAQAQQQQTATLSNDLIERASRLMKENGSGYVPESAKPKQAQQSQQTNTSSQIDYKLIKKMITEAVNDALAENGLMVESTERSSEQFTFKVGKHIFEGKVNKIKKTS